MDPDESSLSTTMERCKHFNPFPAPTFTDDPKDRKDQKKKLDMYKQYMQRIAKTHSARECKFEVRGEPSSKVSSRGGAKGKAPSRTKVKVLRGGRLEAIRGNLKKSLIKLFEPIWEAGPETTLSQFISVQQKLFLELQNPKYLDHTESGKSIGVSMCEESLDDNPSISRTLRNLARHFSKRCSCPNTGNRDLFEYLGLYKSQDEFVPPAGKISYTKQVAQITEIDRLLNFQPDDRCIGFTPTQLQRDILDAIDDGTNFAVKSPTGSGKTMLSLYLVARMVKAGKMTVYVAPSKPICFEFSLFVYHQGVEWSVAYNDDIYWTELKDKNVLICTPNTFRRMLMFPHFPIIDHIGAVIFDELPRMMKEQSSDMAILLMIVHQRGWQTMVLSATLSMEVYHHLELLFHNKFKLLKPRHSTRMTDLVFLEKGDDDRLIQRNTSSTYTAELLGTEDVEARLDRALRFPITLDEFKEIYAHHVKEAGKKSAAEVCRAAQFPVDRVLDGRDITQFGMEYAKAAVDPDTLPQSSDAAAQAQSPPALDAKDDDGLLFESHSEVEMQHEDVSEEELDELFRFLMKSAKHFPMLLFHSSSATLDMYHAGVAKRYEEHIEKKRKESEAKGRKYEAKESDKDAVEENEDVDAGTSHYHFGYMDEERARQIFYYRRKHGGYRFGRAGRDFFACDHHKPISLGLGIHHGGVHKSARDAVEGALRLGHIKVVFCTGTMAFGINMPVKTVVFLGSPAHNDLLTSNAILQAGGRAGRWGFNEKSGQVVFFRHPQRVYPSVWEGYERIQPRWPLHPHVVLQLVASAPELSAQVPRWLSTYHAPLYRWGDGEEGRPSASERFSQRVDLLHRMGLLEDMQLTDGGKVALSIADEGSSSLFAGFLFARYEERLKACIETKEDLMFVLTHFIKQSRGKIGIDDDEEEPFTTLDAEACEVNDELRSLFEEAKAAMKDEFDWAVSPSSELSSLYVHFPNFTPFKNVNFVVAESSHQHLIRKMRILQIHAKLPQPPRIRRVTKEVVDEEGNTTKHQVNEEKPWLESWADEYGINEQY